MDIVRDSNKFSLEVDNSDTEVINPLIQRSYLNGKVVNVEVPATELDGINFINGNNNESFIVSLTNAATLKNQFCKIIINTENEIFYQKEISDLASLLLLNDFLSNVNRFWKSIQWQLISTLIKTLVTKYNSTKHNIVYLSSCLVCVFRKMTERSPIQSNKIKSQLTVFIDVIRQFINYFDYEMGKKWFFCNGGFVDFLFFIADIFMPRENFVSVQDKNIIDNAMTYFKMIKYRQYVFNEKIMKTSMSGKNDLFNLPAESDTGAIKEHNVNRTKLEGRRGSVVRIRGRFVKKTTASAIAAGYKIQRKKYTKATKKK